MNYVVRGIKSDEWARLKELRLAALADPVARIAFVDTHERQIQEPDTRWQERAAQGEAGEELKTFVVEAGGDGPDGQPPLVAMAVVLVERDRAQTHLVGVYIRPEHRGTGLARRLFDTALEWSWNLPEPRVERVRLWVHEDNARARGFYAKLGFTETGNTMAYPNQPRETEYELALARP
ncbi:GNAT family N-acetyltransferase [Streptomyces sp. NPDC057702]|uniref:GNAT family N-acetyltransferase n=1 Tax=unclassified Streptomyces TaxID=2593676 RepID=UPI00367E5BA0